MTNEKAAKIYELYRKGAKVLINSMYVDSFATLKVREDVVLIQSQVWAETPLTKIEFPVTVYQEVDV